MKHVSPCNCWFKFDCWLLFQIMPLCHCLLPWKVSIIWQNVSHHHHFGLSSVAWVHSMVLTMFTDKQIGWENKTWKSLQMEANSNEKLQQGIRDKYNCGVKHEPLTNWTWQDQETGHNLTSNLQGVSRSDEQQELVAGREDRRLRRNNRGEQQDLTRADWGDEEYILWPFIAKVAGAGDNLGVCVSMSGRGAWLERGMTRWVCQPTDKQRLTFSLSLLKNPFLQPGVFMLIQNTLPLSVLSMFNFLGASLPQVFLITSMTTCDFVNDQCERCMFLSAERNKLLSCLKLELSM